MKFRIGVFEGDGIGPEIMSVTLKILDRVGHKFGHEFEYEKLLIGGASIDKYGCPLTDRTLETARGCDALLLAAVGGIPGGAGGRWYEGAPQTRPEAGLLKIREQLGLYCNLRPAVLWKGLENKSPLKHHIIGDSFDILIVRELTGGLYFGKRNTVISNGIETATDTCVYTEPEIMRLLRKGFEAAMSRKKHVCVVDKANVLDTSRLWRKCADKMSSDYPAVDLSYMYVDNCALQLVSNPSQFDVIITENLFGDILSDEAAAITGSIGLLPSASLGDGKTGLYEPVHGSAIELAGKNTADPIAMILSSALMLRYSLDLEIEAMAIENAVRKALNAGKGTADIDSTEILGTKEMGSFIENLID